MTSQHGIKAAALALAAALAPVSAGEAGGAYLPGDQERARWTISDMRSLCTALEAYRLDHGVFPAASSIEELVPFVEPGYMRKAPVKDAWGSAYRYLPSSDRTAYRLVSAGADGVFAESGWSRTGEALDFEQDAVLENGTMVRSWPYR